MGTHPIFESDFDCLTDMSNILICGTPGTGKSTLAEKVGEETGWTVISVGDFAKEHGHVEEYDADRDCGVLNEDPLLDDLEEIQKEGKHIFEYHGADLFPERWFKLVVVLSTDNGVLYDRLRQRNYKEEKIRENIECEIMKIISEEARNGYKEDVVVYLNSNTVEDMEENSSNIVNWINTHT